MTYLQLCEKLRKRTGTGGTEMSNVSGLAGALFRITDYVAEAWRDIQTARRDWNFRWAEFSVTLTAGSQSYDIQALVLGLPQTVRPDSLFMEPATDSTQRYRITLMDYEVFERNFSHIPAVAGRPLYVALTPSWRTAKFNTLLDVDYVFKGKYQRVLQVLASNDDTPNIDEQYHDAIFYRALMKWAEFEEADLIYRTAERAYGEWMDRMVNDLLPKTLIGQDTLA